MSDDKIGKIEEIRNRHLSDAKWRNSPSMLCPQAHDDRAFLLAAVDQLCVDLLTQQGCCDRVEVERMRAENERMREALSWYATDSNYRTRSVLMCGHGEGHSVLVDKGNRARSALEGKP